MNGRYDRVSTMQAADMVGCSAQTIRLAISAGQFPTAVKVGRSWALDRDEVKAFFVYFNSTEFDDGAGDMEEYHG